MDLISKFVLSIALKEGKMYGKEMLLDMYGCDVNTFNRESIKQWLDELCVLIDMKQEGLHFWDYDGVPDNQIPYDKPHLVGISAVQFITTSNIIIHTLDMLGECYITIFSCKEYDESVAKEFTQKWFKAKKVHYHIIMRGAHTKCTL